MAVSNDLGVGFEELSRPPDLREDASPGSGVKDDAEKDADGLVESWARGSFAYPAASKHARLEIANAVQLGHRPGDAPPLAPGAAVPGCGCSRCTNIPADHPARRSLRRRNGRQLDPLPVDDARAVPLLEVAERLGLDLRRVGRSWRGPCPLHGGEHRNFAINPEHGRFKCFVCGEAGDGIELWIRVRGVSFADAVRELAG